MPKKPTILACVTCGSPFKRRRRTNQYCSIACFVRPPEVRLWARVTLSDAPDGCSEWTGSRDVNGYGRVGYKQVPVLAHRLAWELANGPIPDGLYVLHRCDNPPCVRLDHLSLGTQQDNMRDTVVRGRHVQGDRVGTAKLTEADVVAILQRYADGGVTQKALGAEFGVRQSQIQAIVNGRAWKHLQPQH
jgi:hypothetical protein